METVTASVQYGDFKGEAKADEADHGEIQALGAKFGVNGTIAALSFYSGEKGYQQVAIYTAETGGNFEDIQAQAKANGGKLRVKRHVLEGASVTDVLRLFKRFNVVLRYRYPSVEEMVYEPD